MFDKQIRPILDYASEICYMGKQDYEMEKVHLGYLKFLLNAKPSSCTPAVYGACRGFPLIIKQKVQILKYWKRLLNSEKSTAIQNAYNILYESFEVGQIIWSSYIKDIIAETNMNHIWNEQYITNIEIKDISDIVYERFITRTLSDICNLEKFQSFAPIKNSNLILDWKIIY